MELLIGFGAKAMNIATYASNKALIRPKAHMTPYEMWKGRKPNVKYFHVFGSPCYILKDREYQRKFDSKTDEGIFL